MLEEKPRILIIEDDRDLNNLLKYSLEVTNDYKVFSHFNGHLAFEEVCNIKPDLVLLDMMLPNIDGIEILKKIREYPPTAHVFVVLLTARSQEKDKIEGFESGADDYLTKPFSPKELLLRIHALLRRSSTIKSIPAPIHSLSEKNNFYNNVPPNSGQAIGEKNIGIIAIGPIKIFPEEFKVTVNDEVVYLTATEYLLLNFLAERVGKLQSRDALLQKVWGYEGQVHTRTVDTHVKRLRQKLGSAGFLIETVHGFGYQLNTAN